MIIGPGDLVKHVSNNSFGIGIVTDIISSPRAGSASIARVAWQSRPDDIVFPADLFTFEGLTVISPASRGAPQQLASD